MPWLLQEPCYRPWILRLPEHHRESKHAPLDMFSALRANSGSKVAAVLKEDPDDAWMPLLGHGGEQPICCAVRLRCDSMIIAALLAHGADPNATDQHDRTAIEIFEMHGWQWMKRRDHVAVAKLLLAMGYSHTT